MPHWLKKGFYFSRFQYWWPWNVGDPWRPSIYRGSDEYCNRSVVITLPLLGGFVFFWELKRQRTAEDGICENCRADDVELEAQGWNVARD